MLPVDERIDPFVYLKKIQALHSIGPTFDKGITYIGDFVGWIRYIKELRDRHGEK
jgi:hypothetical protein